MVSSKTGQKYMIEKFKFIPAFKTIQGKNLGPLADDIQAYRKAGKTLTWNWFKYPDGASQDFGATMQKYIAKQVSSKQMLEELQSDWDKHKK
jgi:raffinose/stachyose/melibiose transport system substrate-binding protein